MTQTTNELADVAELIGRLWLREIKVETLAAMSLEAFRVPYQELGGFVPEETHEDMVEDLAIEYCALLIGPKGQISPVQSVWETNQFQSATAASMSRYFELIPGYVADSNLSDHIGVQLDYLSALLRQSETATAEEIIQHFSESHLAWTDRFLERVVSSTSSEFYAGLARVTRKLIDSLPASVK